MNNNIEFYMAKQFYGKIISKTLSIVSDLETPDYSDTVLHSKNLIDLLTFHVLKLIQAPDSLRFDRKVADEQKLEFLLDKDLISESIYDNCMNAKGLRNPTEHIFTYPNEYFAKGAALAALELFYALQPKFDFPQINKVDLKAVELGVRATSLIHIQAKSYISIDQVEEIKNIIIQNPGPYTVVLDFPTNTVHPNGKPANGFVYKETANFNEIWRSQVKQSDLIESIEIAGLDHIEKLPYVDEHNKTKFPALFNK